MQQKIFNLMMIFIIALIGVYVSASLVMQSRLTKIVEETNEKQESSISDVSEETMTAVLTESLTKTTALEAYIADELFGDLQSNVMILQTYAEQLFSNPGDYPAHSYSPPDADRDGEVTVQMLHEDGVDPSLSTDLALVANMSEMMLAMYKNSANLSGIFVATTDGCLLTTNDRSASCVENGVPISFDVRNRPWYKRALQEGKLFFTGVEADARTQELCLECITPVYHDGTLVAVIGADIFLSAIRDYVSDTLKDGSFTCIISDLGQVLFSPQNQGTFKTSLTTDSVDLRQSANTALATFVSDALEGKTDLYLIAVDDKEYYMVGVPMATTHWTVVTIVEKEFASQSTVAMLANYEEINAAALQAYKKGVSRTTGIILVLTVVLVVLALIGALFVASRIVKPLEHLTKRINALSGEDSVFEMESVYKTKDEIELLAESFASLFEKTRDYITQITQITAEKERIGTELALATRIQADMLPNIFPAFPDRQEFDIYASMTPAKEVGGDFYDFFLVDDDHLCMVMADVSGKGVPAALFMMVSKIILANNAMMGKSPAQILTDANAAICANNREEMFVTVWLGILEISTGKLTAANAGHEYPVIKHADGKFELFKDKHGLVIGAMNGVKYREYELQLTKGAKLFVYTDGVPEATNADNEMFGTERMLSALNRSDATPVGLLENVQKAVDAFVSDAEQFDDLTMLALEYKGV